METSLRYCGRWIAASVASGTHGQVAQSFRGFPQTSALSVWAILAHDRDYTSAGHVAGRLEACFERATRTGAVDISAEFLSAVDPLHHSGELYDRFQSSCDRR